MTIRRNMFCEQATVELDAGITGAQLNDITDFPEGTNSAGLALLKLEPYSAFPEHTHPYNHILKVEKGLGFVCIEGKRTDLSLGDVINVTGSIVHSLHAAEEDFWVLSISTPAVSLDDPNRMKYVGDRQFKPRLLLPTEV